MNYVIFHIKFAMWIDERVKSTADVSVPSLCCCTERCSKQTPELQAVFTIRGAAEHDLNFPFNIHLEISSQSGSTAYKSNACLAILQNDRDPPAPLTFTKNCVDTRVRR